ncbi:hypothetical protein EV294_101441 [Paenibacillus sp. BK033]|nr:hypothetical protein [Paenibacillus sp. BK720]TCN00990.1 hypothetical protein EV294_101441 [Paenibacillus sp. BK033]
MMQETIADLHENNWTHCNAVILYNEQETRERCVEIRMAAGHEEKRFSILGFWLCEVTVKINKQNH